MIERVIIALAISVALVIAYSFVTRLQINLIQRSQKNDALLSMLQPGIPAVIYFWSEACPPCKLVQKPVLERLGTELGTSGVQIIAVNVQEEPEIANRWGVLGLPTTFIVDGLQRARRVNHGVVRYDQLRQQITAVGQIVKPQKAVDSNSGNVWKEYRVP